MKTSILLLVALAIFGTVAASANYEAKFRDYCATYGKSYTGDEFKARMWNYLQNLKTIEDLNARNGEVAFGENMFTDLHTSEFSARYLGYQAKTDKSMFPEHQGASPDFMPASVDWRNKGVITPVKNQAQCGSCWAFSATEEIESRWAQGGNKLIELSPQQIVSCDQVDQGCNGGDTITAYQYVMQAGGLELNSDYPYTSGNGNNGVCKFNANDVAAHITGYAYATKTSNEQQMQEVIATVGPLSTCVDASTWQFYTGGVVRANCGRQLDHCVQTVGYQDDYWIVRNSWTTGWGENGYIYIEIGQDLCGIADEPTYVSV